ncbi:Peptidyl-tRNA hydrolase [Halomicronema hongdechloris C2206]|uniref:Peptidyl-tRNA hydrolase n=1 Tax=Halomicronema hongdechloris C2206 TaxID=1641165 RepID=A0A1Z3HK14_9CYAN|nr:aminoacyl-tRNA hydrolase [Halomicronema hongdechloris]ASC70648.1 Peptidyl-tRNA hydrolase [Halomicronema hongdechloris C2206]
MTAATPPRRPQLIVGLGNPGDKYRGTRHNIGFEVINRLARTWQIPLKEDCKFQGSYGDGRAGGGKIALLQPLTYMNRSGQSVRAVVDWFKLMPQSVLVVYDDMDLPVGRLRLRLAGSAGGHNGMKSIIAHLGTQDFPRLRLGIGNRPGDKPKDAVISHVLGRFSTAERQTMDAVVATAIDAIDLSRRDGVEKAMSLYNSREIAA